MKLAFIGGTGPEGKGLAYRLALAGEDVIIGSRSSERAREAAADLRERAGPGTAEIIGVPNLEAALAADLVLVTVPFNGQAATLPAQAVDCPWKEVVTNEVHLAFSKRGVLPEAVAEGSAAEQAAALLPASTVVGAFQNLSAHTLLETDDPLDMDVLVCADDDSARAAVMTLAERIQGVRALDAGPLAASRVVESITALLLNFNRRYRAHAGVRIVGVER